MIQYFMDLPIEKQTWSVLALSWLLVTVSAAIRERVKASECRNWARAMGVLGVGLVSLQAIHATMLVEQLNTELMVRRGMRNVEQTEAVATQIADPVRVVAVASEYTSSVAGQTVSIVQYTDGRFGRVSVGGDGGPGSMSVGSGRKDRIGDTAGQRVGSIAGSDGTGCSTFNGVDDLPNAESMKF